MLKHLLFLISILTISCSSIKETNHQSHENFSMKDEINKSIIDGFYNNQDSVKYANLYLLK